MGEVVKGIKYMVDYLKGIGLQSTERATTGTEYPKIYQIGIGLA